MFSAALLVTILIVDLGFILSLLGHEFGHAIAIRLLGGHVSKIVSGSGWTFFHFPWADARVELKILPTWGFTESPDLLQMPAIDQRLVYVAGPLGSLITAIIFAAASWLIKGHGVVFGLHFTNALHLFALVNVFMAIFNLIPVPPLDGFRMLMAGRKTTPEQDRQIRWLSFGVIILAVVLAFIYQPALHHF